MSADAGPFWRVFPWDPAAAPGAPFSPGYVPPPGAQTGGRFDVPGVPVMYLAQTPEHALSEVLRRFQGKALRRGHLRVHDRRAPGTYHERALVRVWIPETVNRGLPDLGDGAVLHSLGIRADTLASVDRKLTQSVALGIHAKGYAGFRWWSALRGDWHATVLFLDRVDLSAIRYDAPEPLDIDHPLTRSVARLLGMVLPAR